MLKSKFIEKNFPCEKNLFETVLLKITISTMPISTKLALFKNFRSMNSRIYYTTFAEFEQ